MTERTVTEASGTEKLYYSDSHCLTFQAEMTSCEADGKGRYAVTLNRTAFFPGGGGQQADTGFIGPYPVLDGKETGGKLLHFISVPAGLQPPEAGKEFSCTLDAEVRLRRMQNHSGEHVFSGLVHRHYGFENVGFHMGHPYMQIDFSGELTWNELMALEQEANEVIRSNLPVFTSFPSGEELKHLEYRSKLELTENVRIVEIPGVDRCACCAPHVAFTGEIGLIKVISAERHKGGVRLELVCGLDALDAVRTMQQSVTEISALLSAKRGEISAAAEKLLSERDALRFRLTGVEKELLLAKAEPLEDTEGNLVLFLPEGYGDAARRELVNAMAARCSGMAGAFSGSDAGGYQYIIGSAHLDLRAMCREINAAVNGRGGGKPEMISGSCKGNEAAIRAWFCPEKGKTV